MKHGAGSLAHISKYKSLKCEVDTSVISLEVLYKSHGKECVIKIYKH